MGEVEVFGNPETNDSGWLRLGKGIRKAEGFKRPGSDPKFPFPARDMRRLEPADVSGDENPEWYPQHSDSVLSPAELMALNGISDTMNSTNGNGQPSPEQVATLKARVGELSEMVEVMEEPSPLL